MTPTADEIEAARTPAGGWTREQLAKWGVGWPPPTGWKHALITETAPSGTDEARSRADSKGPKSRA